MDLLINLTTHGVVPGRGPMRHGGSGYPTNYYQRAAGAEERRSDNSSIAMGKAALTV